ncbi:MAG: hypothetical protein IPK44_02945 [Candidatus Accumulibacter sp.]|uniref:hypothetical protein n=1 Tax=Accumulibacter sp. TaxID=2053492 RepID=UPI00258BDD22|nr:hypothetical protein [Accumulibacter sp.]MBK8113557.1 hypothetical protein [Accumulibacter sp.]
MGGAQERTMLAFAQGVGGIRTVEEINPDGSITRLRTRQGRPTFETEGLRVISGSVVTQLRGFVAKIPGGRAVLFDPYTMEILKTPYTPAAKLYEVQDFLTESTWYDVVLFDGTTIKVNAKAMPRLGITANHGYEAIPHVINYTVGDQYGNAERNTTEKRVFAVGRYSVTSWGGGGVTETLTPTEPRTESRALTIGQRIAGDTAYLGELYHGIDGWDGATEWAFRTAEIQMLLTSAYLVKTSVGANVAMTPPALATTTPFAEDGWRDITYPETPVMLMSSGTVMIPAAYPDTVTPRVAWPWSGSVSKSLEGDVYVNRTGETKSGSQDDAVVAAGVPLTYHAENSKTWTHGYDQNYIKIQTISIAPDAVINEGDVLFGTLGSIYWYAGDAVPGGSHGTQNFNNEYHSYLISSLLYKDWEEQSGIAYIDMGAERLVDVSFSRAQTDGDVLVVTPNTSRYDYLFANPYHILGADFTFGLLGVQAVGFDDSVGDYKNPTGYDQDPSAITEINDKINARLNLLAGRMCYLQEDRAFISSNPWYNATVSSSPTDTSALTWTTKDFIFYDPTNEVYITIEGNFVGEDNEAALTVLLKVQTRHHTTTQTLGSFDYTYSELLPEREIDTRQVRRAVAADQGDLRPAVPGARLVQRRALRHAGRGRWRNRSLPRLQLRAEPAHVQRLRHLQRRQRRAAGVFRAVQPAGDAVRLRVQHGIRRSRGRHALPGHLHLALQRDARHAVCNTRSRHRQRRQRHQLDRHPWRRFCRREHGRTL